MAAVAAIGDTAWMLSGKRFRALALAASAWAALAAPGHAQLMHLSLRTTARFYPDYTGATYELFDAPLQLDLTYDAGLVRANPDDAFDDLGGQYIVDDPARNFWRLRTTGVDVSQPLDYIVVSRSALVFRSYGVTPLEQFDLTVAFAGTISTDGHLPVGPLPPVLAGFEQPSLVFYGGPEAYGGDDPANAGWLAIDPFTASSSEWGDPLPAVPEPATYGAVAAGFLGVVIVWRRRRRARRSGGEV